MPTTRADELTTIRSVIPVSVFGSSRRREAQHGHDAGEVPPAAFDVSAAYDRHGSAIFGFAVNALRDRSLAEDCVQDTFLRAWRARDRFDPAAGSERTWLFAIARNVIIDAARTQRRVPHPVGDELDARLPAFESDPLERLGLLESLAMISREHRDVVVAIHVVGLSYAELSSTTGVPVATLRTRAYYGLRALRALLDREELSDDPR